MVFLCKINFHGTFSRWRILFLNFLVKVLPYLPMNGSRSHILGRLSGVAVSVVPECSVLLLSWCGVKALIIFLVRSRNFLHINSLMRELPSHQITNGTIA